MKKSLFFIATVLARLFTNGQDSAKCVSISDLVDVSGYKYLIKDRKTPFTGKACWFYADGKRELELLYVKGKLNGFVRDWFPEGSQRSLTEYQRGIQTGIYKVWDCAGNLEIEGRFNNNQKEGQWTYFQNGLKTASGRFINDRKDDVWQFYNSAGYVVKLEFYDTGGTLYKTTLMR